MPIQKLAVLFWFHSKQQLLFQTHTYFVLIRRNDVIFLLNYIVVS